MELKIPPPVYMLVFAGLMWLVDQYFPIYQWPINTNILSFVLIAMGGYIDFSSLVKFIRAKTTINPMHPDYTKKLVTSGMYRVSRNPMYLGLLFLLSGWSLYLGSLSSFVVIPFFIFTITQMQIRPEEKILQQRFGQEYLDYKKRVPRWL